MEKSIDSYEMEVFRKQRINSPHGQNVQEYFGMQESKNFGIFFKTGKKALFGKTFKTFEDAHEFFDDKCKELNLCYETEGDNHTIREFKEGDIV